METRKIAINTRDASHLGNKDDSFEKSEAFRVVDKRHFAHGEEGSASVAAPEDKPRYPTYVEELLARVANTERRFTEKVKQIDQETARLKLRLEAELERKLDLSKRDLLLPLLDVLDNLERALQAAPAAGSKEELHEGLTLTVALFRSRLQAQGIEAIEVLHLPFDPNQSEALGVIPIADPLQDGLVVEEVLRGYRMGDSLLRPARVRVGEYRPDQTRPG